MDEQLNTDDLLLNLEEDDAFVVEETPKKKSKKEVKEEPVVNMAALKSLDAQLSKEFGENYYGFSSDRKIAKVPFTSWGCLTLDQICGGGLPIGRLVQISGKESTGK